MCYFPYLQNNNNLQKGRRHAQYLPKDSNKDDNHPTKFLTAVSFPQMHH